jgi:hypothetical protein
MSTLLPITIITQGCATHLQRYLDLAGARVRVLTRLEAVEETAPDVGAILVFADHFPRKEVSAALVRARQVRPRTTLLVATKQHAVLRYPMPVVHLPSPVPPWIVLQALRDAEAPRQLALSGRPGTAAPAILSC